MYNVSAEYKVEIEKTLRNPTYMKVRFGVVDPQASQSSTITDNGSIYYSETSKIDDEDIAQGVQYSTLEHNFSILDGKTQLIDEESVGYDYQGFVGNELSDENGNYSTIPEITINFSTNFSFLGLLLNFNRFNDNYPTQVQILAYQGETLVYDQTKDISSNEYIWNEPVPTTGTLNKIIVKLLNSNIPNRRARLSAITFGIFKNFDDLLIKSTSWNRSVDPISTNLPINTFSFSFIDKYGEYDPENPEGIWQYIEKYQPVNFEYGYKLDNGAIEWIAGTKMYTTSDITIENKGRIPIVTINAGDRLSYMTDIWKKGVYNATPVSLGSLAEEICDYYGFSYSFDSSLYEIYTSTPLLEEEARVCLQVIANAGKMALYVNRNNEICIKPFSTSEIDFNLDFTKMTSIPQLNKIPLLGNVITKITNYTPEDNASQLYKAYIDTTTNIDLEIDYDASTDISSSVDGTLTIVGTPEYYARTAFITVNGTGNLTINGKKLVLNESNVVVNHDANGENLSVSNELINNYNDAVSYANFLIYWLSLRNEFSVDDRGYPALDIGDYINVQTYYSLLDRGFIVKNKLDYDGSLTSTTTFIKGGA